MTYYFDTPLTYDERLELIPALSDEDSYVYHAGAGTTGLYVANCK